jgi:hypothetical protein
MIRKALVLAALAALFIAPAALAADDDGDGVSNLVDNCTLASNADQADADGDGYGNACDGDYNNDGVVDDTDQAIIQAALNTDLAAADHDGSGSVMVSDLTAFLAMKGQPVGPSAKASN